MIGHFEESMLSVFLDALRAVFLIFKALKKTSKQNVFCEKPTQNSPDPQGNAAQVAQIFQETRPRSSREGRPDSPDLLGNPAQIAQIF